MAETDKVLPLKKTDPEQIRIGQEKTPQLSDLNSPELVIALCGPIGSPIHEVAARVKETLIDEFDYQVEIIRLSDFIKDLVPEKDREGLVPIATTASAAFRRAKSLIAAGNRLREKYGSGVLAELAIHRIATTRDPAVESKTKPRRQCFIVDSIKNQSELLRLRDTYGDIFHFLGVFASLRRRAQRLSEQMPAAEVQQLIDQDSGEEIDTGQTVRDTFTEADYFLRVDSLMDTVVEKKVERLLHVIFKTKLVTPTVHETAMYQAASAAGNSACLSRQVGAAITDAQGEIVSVGWNDVPKFGGSLYRPGGGFEEPQDFRCWNLEGGTCFNDREKDVLAALVVTQLKDEGLIEGSRYNDAFKVVRSSAKLGNLLEFSRSIHAEMHAILSAGHLNGGKLLGARLYATTYPCHSCARHIVAAGISEVYYIEPYRKSLAIKLHSDAITESEDEEHKVKILMFEGVAPRRYLSLFRVAAGKSRKSNGKLVKVHPSGALPANSMSLESIPVLESITVKRLQGLNLVK
jgi:deoxycytidylate deaminase